MTRILSVVVGMMPASKFKNFLLRVLGHRVDPSAVVQPCLILGNTLLSLEAFSAIGLGTVFRNTSVDLGIEARVGQWNWISSAVFERHEVPSSLHVGYGAAITSRHYVDCTGGVRIGEMAIIGGQRSTILSHQINFATNKQSSGHVDIGRYSFVSSNCVLIMNSVLPPASVLAAGSTLTPKALVDDARGGLYRGNPARWERALTGKFFARQTSYVGD